MVKNPLALQELQKTKFPSLCQEDPLEKGVTIHSCFLAWRIQMTEKPGDYSPWHYKELNTTERLTEVA